MRLSISNGLSISGQQTGSAGGGGTAAVSFGALTLAGAGGVAKPAGATNISDDGGTNLTLTSGFAVPATNGVTSGTVVWDDGTEWTVTAVANKYSCKCDTTEIGAAWTAANTATATGILVRDGDDSASAVLSLAAKSFTSQFVIEPHDFTKAATPDANTWGVKLPGIFLGAGTSNVKLYGLDCYDTYADVNNAVIEHETGGTIAANLTVEACHAHSRNMFDAFDNGIFGDSVGFSAYPNSGAFLAALNQANGVRLGDCNNARMIDCYVEHVRRGYSFGNVGISGGNRSRIQGNYFENNLQYFGDSGGTTNGLDIWDNRGLHTWGSDLEVPSNPIHGSVGLAFNPPAAAGDLCQNITVFGNIFSVGWSRKKYTTDNSLTYTATNASTGAKFNDPNLDASNSASYSNIQFGFNVIVTGGIGIEFSGADSIDIFNNTLIKDADGTASGSGPVITFNGSSNTRLWNNLSPAYDLGDQDDTGFYTATLSDLEGYGNTKVYEESYFKADSLGSYPRLTISDLETAFEPDVGRLSLAATQKQGALGTGLYSGAGVHSVTYDPLVAAAGTAHTSNDTVWDGATRASLATGMSNGKQVSFVFEGKCGASTDGTLMYFYGSASNGFRIYRNTDNKVYISAKEGTSTTIILDCNSDFTITEADGEFTLAIAVDLANRQVRMLKNGVQDRWMGPPSGASSSVGYDVVTDDTMNLSASRRLLSNHTTGTGYWKGQVHAYWLTDEFIDFDIQSELNAVFTSTGAIKDPGATGSNYTGTAANVCLIGAASTYTTDANGGTGGAVAAEGGTVTDADTTAPTLSSPTDAANGATASTGSVSTDEGNGTLYWVVTTSATAPSAAQVKAGQDNGGSAATDSGSQAVSGTGVQTLSPAPSGLTASTSYTTHFMHEDSSGNQSAVASASGFTTASAGGITVVGTVTGVAEDGTDATLTLPGTPAENDIVVVIRAQDSDSGSGMPAISGYTSIVSATADNPNFDISWKRLGATPDTTVTVPDDGSLSSDGFDQACIAYLVRGVDTTTAIDVTSPAVATGSGSSVTLPVITTTTNGALVITAAGLDDRGDGTTVTGTPSGYGDLATQATAGGLNASVLLTSGAKLVATAGIEMLGAYTFSASDAYVGATIALRPA